MIMVIFVANVGGFPNSALAFNWFGQPTEEKDPVEPFTLYGSIFKKYLIEDLVEGKIVGRRKGFTASAWVVVVASQSDYSRVFRFGLSVEVTPTSQS
ncbi:unnamed protein product, partial [Sphagnum jensenii]